MKKHKFAAIVLALVLTFVWSAAALASPPVSPPGLDKGKKTQHQERFGFSDENEAPWASQYMVRMKARGVFAGYPDGTFKPNASISQGEAVKVVVEAFRGNAEVDVTATVRLPGIQANLWVAPYLAFAAEKGWIELENFQVNRAATRAWFSRLIYMAGKSKIDSEVSNMNTAQLLQALRYKDKHDITEDCLAAVYWLTENGILAGYGDGMFLPNKPVTRAEAAKILSMMLDELPDETTTVVSGIFRGSSGNVIYLRGTATGYRMAANVRIFLDGAEVGSISDLLPGDPVRLQLDSEGLVIVVEATAKEEKVEGQITAITPTPTATHPWRITVKVSARTERTLDVASDVQVLYGNEVKPFSFLMVGDTVEVTVKRDVATKIVMKDSEREIQGTVTDKNETTGEKRIKIRSGGTEQWYEVADNVEVVYDEHLFTFGFVHTGDTVEITLSRDIVTRIEVENTISKQRVTGTIQAMTFTNETILSQLTLEADSTSATYAVASTVLIEYDGEEIPAGDLASGDRVECTLIRSVVVEIEKLGP
ncbi:MAG: S-layer homology domain-containing protein [Bacillota bacterium]